MDKIKWIWLGILLIIVGCKSVPDSINENPIVQNNLDQANFPESWEGNYLGKLKIFKAGQTKPSQEVDMELIIEQVSLDSQKYEWKIIYGKDKIKGLREYQLITKDRSKGLYVIDERNSILLDAYFINGALISRFSVSGNLISAIYRKVGNSIYFEILSGNEKVDEFTGGKGGNPNVGNYKITVSQTAVLTKISSQK